MVKEVGGGCWTAEGQAHDGRPVLTQHSWRSSWLKPWLRARCPAYPSNAPFIDSSPRFLTLLAGQEPPRAFTVGNVACLLIQSVHLPCLLTVQLEEELARIPAEGDASNLSFLCSLI